MDSLLVLSAGNQGEYGKTKARIVFMMSQIMPFNATIVSPLEQVIKDSTKTIGMLASI